MLGLIKADATDDDEPSMDDVADRFVTALDDDVEWTAAPDGDTTAEDYADYTPSQPIGKAFDPSEARAGDGEWTSGGGESSSSDLDAVKSIAKSVAIGAALTGAATLIALAAPELFALAGGAAAGEAAAAAGASAAEAVAAATIEGRLAVVTKNVKQVAQTQFFNAGLKTVKLALQHLGVDTKAIEDRIKPLQDAYNAVTKAAGGMATPDLIGLLTDGANDFRDALLHHLAHYKGKPVYDAVVAGIDEARDVYLRDVVNTMGKVAKRRLGAEWRRPDAIPFDRPATRKAEASIAGRMTAALTALGAGVSRQMRGVEKVAKAAPDEPENPDDVEDRARQRANEIVAEFDLGALYAEAEPVGADLEDVVTDAVERAVAQLGPDDRAGLVNQVNERAVAIARERAAELVGMRYDASGALVPSDDAEMAITDTTRDMLRATIADGLAAGKTLDEIADEIGGTYAFSPDRAAVIAATEVSRANSMAALESYRAVAALGVPVRKAWLVTTACCDECATNAAQGAIDLDDAFESGDDTPPGHPNCRCSLTPVVGEDAEKVAKTYDPGEMRGRDGRWISAEMADVIKAGKSKGPLKRRVIGVVEDASTIRSLTGIDVDDFRYVLSNEGVRHALDRHGISEEERGKGQLNLTDDDFHLLPQIVAGPDWIRRGRRDGNAGEPRIKMRKVMGEAAYTVVGEIKRRRRRIDFVTMWKRKAPPYSIASP